MKNICAILFLALISVFSVNKAEGQCAANFSYTISGNTVTFSDLSTAGSGTIISWGWSFGDAGFSGSQNPVHTFAGCGTYNVSLLIATSAFCIDTYSTTVTVNGGIPASFNYTVDTVNGHVNFLAAPLGLNLNYVWNFGDGTYDSTAFINHAFPPGTYNVCLTVADNSSVCSATYCDTVIVPPLNCSTAFTWNNNGNGFANFQVTPFHFGMTYTWDYGDSTSGTGPFTLHNFPALGSYNVCLTAVDSATMCSSHFCDTVVLTQNPNTCNVTFTYGNNNGQVIFFANSISFSNTYAWNFGDGNLDTGFVVSNAYMSSGTYYACLTTTNSTDSCSATSCDSVEVVIAGIEENEQDNFGLKVYPNPAHDITEIAYHLNSAADVQLIITDLLGKTIAVPENGRSGNGDHITSWNAESVESGIYLLQIKVDGRIRETRKIIVAK